MRYISFSFLLLLLAVGASAETLSLDSCRALAVQNYPLVKQYELIEQTREFTIKNANKAYLPQLSATLIGGVMFGDLVDDTEFRLIGTGQLSQTVWDGGATKSQKDIANAQAQVNAADLDVELYGLGERVNQLYFGILLVQEQLEQLAIYDTLTTQNYQRISQLSEQGMAYVTDVQEVEVERLNIVQQRTELEHVLLAYKQMLSIFIGKDITQGSSLETPPMEAIAMDGKIARPEMNLFSQQANLVASQDKMRKVALMPKFGLIATGVYLTPGADLGMSEMNGLAVVGLSMNWELSGLYKNKSSKELNKISLQSLDLQQEAFVFNVNLETQQEQQNIAKQQALLTTDEEIVQMRAKIRQGYEAKYENGVCTMLDLLDASQRENEAQMQRTLHQIELLEAYYDYKNTNGK